MFNLQFCFLKKDAPKILKTTRGLNNITNKPEWRPSFGAFVGFYIQFSILSFFSVSVSIMFHSRLLCSFVVPIFFIIFFDWISFHPRASHILGSFPEDFITEENKKAQEKRENKLEIKTKETFILTWRQCKSINRCEGEWR